MLRGLTVCALVALAVTSVAAASSSAVVFKGATVTANAAGGGIAIKVAVLCTGARHYSAHVWLASKQGANKSFFDQTVTGAVTSNKGAGAAQYRGQVPASGFIVAGSNVFCWSQDKSMGVGYRDLFVAYCSARGSCEATSGRPGS